MSVRGESFLFLGFAIPDQLMQVILTTDKFPAMQTHLFVWKLIYSLERGLGEDSLDIISTRPISDYPLNPEKVIKSKTWSEPKEIREIGFLNYSILKQVSRFFTSLIEGLKWLIRKKRKKAIIVYSVHSPFMFTGYILSKISKLPLIGVWTDPPLPSVKGENLLKTFVRKWDYKIAKTLMTKMDASIVLTKQLALDFNPSKPYLVVEAIADIKNINLVNIEPKTQEFVFLYSGALAEIYGIRNLIKAFMKLPYENANLILYGKGNMEAEINEFVKVDKRIVYKGMRPNQEVITAQRRADVLINPRPTNEEYTKYSFPSKTLEYMLTGTPVVTTKLEGIPLNYFDYVYSFESHEEKDIFDKLKLLYNCPKEKLKNKGLKAMKFASQKSIEIQGDRIGEFIKTVIK